LETQKKVDAAYANKATWAKKSIMAAAGMGKFSSDRSIQDYAKNIWKVTPVPA
jgi:starch phosphorylase